MCKNVDVQKKICKKHDHVCNLREIGVSKFYSGLLIFKKYIEIRCHDPVSSNSKCVFETFNFSTSRLKHLIC